MRMHKLVHGVQKFQHEVFATHSELFAKLGDGQKPHTLFITCSDSRINPNLITQSDPGEIFIVRNVGNLVPGYGGTLSAEAAAVEYAVAVLKVENIVVCGHSNCGAMKALLDPEVMRELPAVRAWAAHAESTRRIIEENYRGLSPDQKLNITIQENVLVQLDNLRTHPTVAAAVARGKLHLLGWVYKIPTGEIFGYDPAEAQFRPLHEFDSVTVAPRTFGDVEAPVT